MLKLGVCEKWKWKLLSCVWFFVHGILQAKIPAGVGSLSFLQGIFPTQGLNPGLPHCRWILYQLSHKGSPRILEWVAYPFSSRSSRPRNRTGVSCIAAGFFTNWAVREALKLWEIMLDRTRVDMIKFSGSLKEGISFVCPATWQHRHGYFASNILFFPSKLCSLQWGSCGKEKQLWFWQVLTASLNFCLMCHWQIFCMHKLGRGKALWTSFQGNTNPLTVMLQSGINLIKKSCYYPCVPSIFSLFSTRYNKRLKASFLSLTSLCI